MSLLSDSSYADTIGDALQRVEIQLQESLKHPLTQIQDMTQHLAAAGGKRLRPMLVALCAGLGDQGVTDEVITAAVGVELTHLATLYHDDVMDSANTRRGVDSAQVIWGNNRAILAGDLIFARASQAIATLGPTAVMQHARTYERLCSGQINETFGPGINDDSIEFYLRVLADKTGSLVAQAARYGAELGGASAVEVDAVADYGEKIGVAFQIADDVLDLMSDTEVSGKTPGTDLREGVDTLPVLLLRRETDAAGREILGMLDSRNLDDDAVLADIVARLRVHPVIEQTRQMALNWADDAQAALVPLQNQQVRDALGEFADLLVNRVA